MTWLRQLWNRSGYPTQPPLSGDSPLPAWVGVQLISKGSLLCHPLPSAVSSTPFTQNHLQQAGEWIPLSPGPVSGHTNSSTYTTASRGGCICSKEPLEMCVSGGKTQSLPPTLWSTGISPSTLYICNCKAEKHQQGALQEGPDHRDGSRLSCSSLAGYWGAGGSRLGGPDAQEFGSVFETVFSTLARWVQGALSHVGD